MTHEDVMQMLAETEIPFAYDHFAEGESPDPPFICFLFPGSENFAADNVVYMEFSNLSIELYTDEKDPELEDRVEAVLNANELTHVDFCAQLPVGLECLQNPLLTR